MASPENELFGGLRVPRSDESSRGQSGPTALRGATQHCLVQPSWRTLNFLLYLMGKSHREFLRNSVFFGFLQQREPKVVKAAGLGFKMIQKGR